MGNKRVRKIQFWRPSRRRQNLVVAAPPGKRPRSADKRILLIELDTLIFQLTMERRVSVKASCTVWDGGKAGDDFKSLPIVILLW